MLPLKGGEILHLAVDANSFTPVCGDVVITCTHSSPNWQVAASLCLLRAAGKVPHWTACVTFTLLRNECESHPAAQSSHQWRQRVRGGKINDSRNVCECQER